MICELAMADEQQSLAAKYGVGDNKKVTCRPQHPRYALEVTIKLLEALEELHSRSLVYCDVQPEKIMITDSDICDDSDEEKRGLRVSLVRSQNDTCRQTGSPGSERCWEYSAPEQWSGDQVGEGTDVFGAAGVLFYLLSGRAPFFSEDCSREKYHDLAKKVGIVPGEFDLRVRDDRVLSANPDISHDLWHNSLNGLLGRHGLRHVLWMTLGQKQGTRISVHTMKTWLKEILKTI
jgi:serine/threonine protein kinase